MKVRRSIEIAAPPEKVWPLLVEPGKILQWYIPLEKFEFTSDQRSGVGAPFHFEEKVAGRLMKLDCEVTEWEDNQRLAFTMTSGTMVKSYGETWTVETAPSGSRFTFEEDIELPYGVMGKMLGPFARVGSQATIGKMLPKLKSLAEA